MTKTQRSRDTLVSEWTPNESTDHARADEKTQCQELTRKLLAASAKNGEKQKARGGVCHLETEEGEEWKHT
jgi:hypothetical protein